MKVNRFAMSQKVFCKMFVHWFNVQLHIAQSLRFNNAKEEALVTLDDAERLAKKTFNGNEEPFEMREHRATLARLRMEITQELSAPREASVHSS